MGEKEREREGLSLKFLSDIFLTGNRIGAFTFFF